MNERLLHFIWQFQYFNRQEIETTNGQAITILHPGSYNTNQGPDFLNARLIINNTTWVGSVELHVRTSDWLKHQHSNDSNYTNVILHVVWFNDVDLPEEKANFATLELHNRTPKMLLEKFSGLMQNEAFVPCQPHLPAIGDVKWVAWKERLAIERLQRKSMQVLTLYKAAKNHWEEVFWWQLAENFGGKVNGELFLMMAQSLPITLLGRHKHQIHQVESLLFGQAGLLNGTFAGDYPVMLQKEYWFYQKKYNLLPVSIAPHYLRMRPANFPTIRLAQLAMLVHSSTHLFSKIIESASISDIKNLLNVTANDYWHYHYKFDEPGAFQPKQLGSQMVENIIINTIVPVLFAWGYNNNDNIIRSKALEWLSTIPAEKNSITTRWQQFGVTNKNALESQALIELKNNYCNKKRCLECAVGNAILKKTE